MDAHELQRRGAPHEVVALQAEREGCFLCVCGGFVEADAVEEDWAGAKSCGECVACDLCGERHPQDDVGYVPLRGDYGFVCSECEAQKRYLYCQGCRKRHALADTILLMNGIEGDDVYLGRECAVRCEDCNALLSDALSGRVEVDDTPVKSPAAESGCYCEECWEYYEEEDDD